MIRVLVAEDSVTVRQLLVAILEGDPEFRVVGQAKNGMEAVELARSLRPDLITMDIHMPLMDGFAATKEIMVQAPTPIIIVSSCASGRDVEMSLNALRSGALMVVSKPEAPGAAQFPGQQAHFLAMAKAMAEVKVVRRWRRSATGDAGPAAPLMARPADRAVRLVAMAASTGGPAALQRILMELPADYPLPILVVQHIASGFAEGLADWLAATCDLQTRLAVDGEPLTERTVFLAPDERQLGVRQDGRLLVSEAPPVGGFRPSATYLFESVARAHGPGAAAVILTGMGVDGVAGLGALRQAGGLVIAQDQATSVVFGMPGAAAAAGYADAVLPLDDIAARLVELARGTDPSGRAQRRGAPTP